MTPFIGQYIEYSQLYDDLPPNLENVIKFLNEYNSKEVLQILCKVNIALWKTRGDFDNKLQTYLFELFFPEYDRRRIANKLNRIKKNDSKSYMVLFHRHQILFAIKLVLLNPNTESTKEINYQEFGKILLAISELLHRDPPSLADRYLSVHYDFVRKSITSLTYFSHFGIFINNLSRTFILWEDIPKTVRGKEITKKLGFDLNDEFKKASGLTINEYLTLGFLQMGKLFDLDYTTSNPSDFMLPRNYLSKTSLPKFKQKGIYDAISQNIGDYEESSYIRKEDGFFHDFMSLIDKPVININEQYAIIADPQYFEEKLSNGPYWILHNYFKKSEGEKSGKAQRLSAFYGELHEIYVEQVLNRLCHKVIRVKERSKEELKMCDYLGIILTKESETFIIAIESKKVALSLNLTIFAEEETTTKELGKIFGDKGFGQVYNTINLIQNTQIDELNGVDLSNVAGIFPVVVTDRFIVEDPATRNFYETKFFNPMYEKYKPKGKFLVAHPVFISIEELEIIEATKEGGKNLSFLEILLHRNSVLNKRFYKAQPQILKDILLRDVGFIVHNLESIWNTLYLIGYSEFPNKRLQNIAKFKIRSLGKKLFSKNK